MQSINFALTNWIPRRSATRLMARLSRIEQPLVRDASMWVWQFFGGDLQLHEAKKTTFTSVHDCFVRELREGARPIDSSANVLVSPCDGIVGQSGRIDGTRLIQAKDFAYSLEDLLLDGALVHRYRNGRYVTLRLSSTMYHRFHAPDDCEVREIRYIAGDTWNVNPATLTRVRKVFCRNERAVVTAQLVNAPESISLVAIAAILVGGICLNVPGATFNLDYPGPERIVCRHSLTRGQEVGYFNHGSTIVVLVSSGFELCEAIQTGRNVRVGEPLLCRPITRSDGG
jgi:phosphatidylserine decarboxylase